MELQKQGNELEFKWRDVAFCVRARATAEDRFEINILYDVDKLGTVTVPRREVYRTLIKRFVTGWTGVTRDGEPVPFSLENLGDMPLVENEDPILLLGSFIFQNCGLWPGDHDALKKKD